MLTLILAPTVVLVLILFMPVTVNVGEKILIVQPFSLENVFETAPKSLLFKLVAYCSTVVVVNS